MRSFIMGMLTVAGIAFATPASAQLYLETPLGGVGVGVRNYDRHDYDGRYHSYDYDQPRYRSYDYDRPRYQSYGYRDGGCRTITVQRDDGSVRRIRRCG